MVFYLQEEIVPEHISVVGGYDIDDELVLPSVAIESGRIVELPLELGNKDGIKEQIWYIDVFAKSKQQRDDLADLVYENLPVYIPVNDYEQGFPDPQPPRMGKLTIVRKERNTMVVPGDLLEKLYWQGRISLVTRYEEDF